MDEKATKFCPNCSQCYHIKNSKAKTLFNIPLFLSCGHTVCENCVSNIVKFNEPIECKVCHKDMQVNNDDLALLAQNKISLYNIFPVNVFMVGELTLQSIKEKKENKGITGDEHYLDIRKLMLNNDKSTQGECLECYGPTTKMCEQCGIIVCNSCFNKSHKNFVIFKNHVLRNIEGKIQKHTCKTHKNKTLDYYCKECKKYICMDCLMVGGEKSCKSHDVTSMQEMNENILTELSNISPKVDEMLRRLSKTAVDIGNLLSKLDNENNSTEYTLFLNNIEQHFSKVTAIVQKQKDEITNKVLKLKITEKESLKQAKQDIAAAIKTASCTLIEINSLDPNNLKEINMSAILEEAKHIAESPWYLHRDEESKMSLNLTVNEEYLTSLDNYIRLEGKEDSKYKLCTTDELREKNEDIPAPPTSIIYPPELIKDVRQLPKPNTETENLKPPTFFTKVPKYRSKSGSCTSLNSVNSDTSNKSYNYMSYAKKQQMEQNTAFSDIQPRPLCEGAQELIYISHIVDPHNFYVQRACHQSLVQELLMEFRNAVALPKPSIAHVAEGKIYLVFNKADNLWQRCRVMSINRRDVNKLIFHVFCIDFGSTEVVSIEKLRLIPSGRVQFPPPFAISCRLDNCEPINGSWTSDDAFFIQNIIDNQQAVLHVRRVEAAALAAGGAVTLRVDVCTFEHGVSLAHALAFHARARMPDKRPYAKMMGIKEKPKLFISNNDFQKNSVEEVYITHTLSPDHFYVRKCHLQPVYEKLCEDLDQEYSLSITSGSIFLPEVDMVCVANVEKCGLRGGAWQRAVVRELPGRERVRVLLPDVGATELLHWTALRRILPKFTVLRALSTECHLAGVTPLNKKWNSGSVALLHKFEDRVLELHVDESRNRSSLGVTLYDKSDEENVICINKQMIKNKFAVSFGIFMFNKNLDTDELVYTNKSPLDEPKPKPKGEKDKIKILKKQSSKPKKPQEEDLEAKDKGPLRLEAKILNYQSPSLLYVSLVHQQKVFTELFENIQQYYSKNRTQGKTNWNVEDRCCTICNQSQTWRRAAILEINGDNAKVFYSDFACVETVPISSLRELTKEFTSMGDAAIMCHLCGVIPAVGDEWPSLTKEYLKELIDAYNRFFITKLGKFKGKSMPVELWVYHTIQGGALEPNTSEWRCLNKKIIDQGLGIPDKSQEESGSDKKADNTADDMLSFLNITGSVHDWLQIEPTPSKPLLIKPDSDSNSSTPIHIDESKMENSNLCTVFISDWLPPEPLPNNEFTAMPTYIDNDGVIYLHDISQQDTYDLIRKALDVRFKKPDPKAKFVKWTVGEPCIALFFLDNSFYRGRVLEVNEENSSCLIHYVDFGNEEICSFENLRKTIVLHQIPIQAQKCVLNRIRPAGKRWDRESLDYIHKSVVEKQCYVKVSGPPIGNLIPIELKYNKLWINDHLVDFEMAVYTDGSKAVIRKFAPNIQDTRKLNQTIESDSGPDYIVEDDDDDTEDQSTESQSVNSFHMSAIEGKDWNEIIAEDESQSINGNFMTYSPFTEIEFLCNITVLNEIEKFELSVVHDDETTRTYEKMFEELQNDDAHMNALDGIYENKACLALYPDDGKWYRAIILQYSEAKNRIKVKYVDYGNINIISLDDVTEISEKHTRLPPATITVTLHGVKYNPSVEKKLLLEKFADTFMNDETFHAKVINATNLIPSVELRDDNEKLIYDDLIQENVLLRSN